MSNENQVSCCTAADGARPVFSVVIPTYNRVDILETTLRAYAGQSLGHTAFEVLVVDDGSTDATAERLECLKQELPYRLRLFRQPNQGPGQARNLAIGESVGDFVLITGDDIVPNPRMLESHLQTHRRHPEPASAVLGKVEWHPDCPVTPLMHHVTDLTATQFGYTKLDAGTPTSYRYFYTCNVSLKTDFLHGQELFRSAFVHAAYEDIELAYRLEKAGMAIHYDPQALGFHYHPMTIAGFSQRQYKCGLMASVFAAMHPELEAELGITTARANRTSPRPLRDQIRNAEMAFATGPLALYHERPYQTVPSDVMEGLSRYFSSLLGAYYLLGVCEGVSGPR